MANRRQEHCGVAHPLPPRTPTLRPRVSMAWWWCRSDERMSPLPEALVSHDGRSEDVSVCRLVLVPWPALSKRKHAQ